VALSSAGIRLDEPRLSKPGIELIAWLRQQFQLELSISHCPEMVAIALGRDRLGVDCETLGTNRNWQAIADYFFTPAEADTIRQSRVIQQEHIFLRHWTLKEAFIKTMQGTIFGNLNDLTLQHGKIARITTGDIKQWSIWQAQTGNCLLGLCYRQGQIGKPVWLECADLSRGMYSVCEDLDSTAARIAC
jgi:phosphopantetheinyl transferase